MIGTSVAFPLREIGTAVIAICAREAGHQCVSSHGHSCATRTGVGEDISNLPLIRRSSEIWDVIEKRGCDLRRRTGLLYLTRSRTSTNRHSDADFVRTTCTVADAANTGQHSATKVVLAIGPWMEELAGSVFARDHKVSRKIQYRFATEQEDLWEQRCSPVFMWFHSPTTDDMFYGFPFLDGGKRPVKTATDQYADACGPSHMERSVSPDIIAFAP